MMHEPRRVFWLVAVVALCAGALDTSNYVGAVKVEGMPQSLKAFLDPTANYNQSPEIYCFGLLEWFDRRELERLATAE